MILLIWESKINDANELIYQTEIQPQTQKTNLSFLPLLGEVEFP